MKWTKTSLVSTFLGLNFEDYLTRLFNSSRSYREDLQVQFRRLRCTRSFSGTRSHPFHPSNPHSVYSYVLISSVQQNKLIEAKIQRRPSRVTANQQNTAEALAAPTSLSLPLGSAMAASSFGSLNLSTSLGPSSSHGPQIFLRIRVADTADAVHISTTIPV